jgi:phosphoglycolate phosphatase-like HAD superfamily hydrolase
VIIGGGNSYYRDDIAQAEAVGGKSIHHGDVGMSKGVWGLERGYCLMIGGEDEVVERRQPIFEAIAPGVERAERTAGRTGEPSKAERGYLHCGPNGAGHFVKMVHNGIEYGAMAAYAEDLNILKNANAGAAKREADAETPPLETPQFYRYDLGVASVAEVWRRGSVIASWLLDLTAARWPHPRPWRSFPGGCPTLGKAAGRRSPRSEGACRRPSWRPHCSPGSAHETSTSPQTRCYPPCARASGTRREASGMNAAGPVAARVAGAPHASAVLAGRLRSQDSPSNRSPSMAPKRLAILFDIDGTLIITGGAGAASWRMAFDELYGIPADIGQYTDTGMTDPDVGRQTFVAVLHRQPSRAEFARLLERRLHYLYQTVADSGSYRVLDGVGELLPQFLGDGYLLGIVTGDLEAAARIKLHRARLNRFFSFGGYGSDATDRGELTRIAFGRAALVYGAEVSPRQCLIAGDTPMTPRGRTGIACVGVASHNFNAEQLRAGGADVVIASLKEGLPL